MQEIGVEKAIRFFGSISELAKKIKINREKIYRYLSGNKAIPKEVAEEIEFLTKGEISCKELLPWKTKNYNLICKAPCITREILIKNIIILNEIPSFPDQENLSPPNQKPICIDENNHLIYGLEAINACKKQGKKSVFGWRLSLSDLLNGNYEIDDLIQTFDLLERTAIGISLEKFIGNRQGLRTDTKELVDEPSTSEIEKEAKTRSFIAKRIGFASDYTYRQLKKILQSGCPKLIYQIKHNKISVSKAASLAELPPTKQVTLLSKPY